MKQSPAERTTLATLRRMARQGDKFAMLTCYDATTAKWLVSGGVQCLLVGDTAAQMILGYEHTNQVSIDFMLTITAAVRRGAPNCFIMGDMPFMSYQADDAEAIRNAGRFMTQGGADAVKLEVGPDYVDLIRKLVRADVPIVAHIGWRPQRFQQVGMPIVAGRTETQVSDLVDLALKMQDQGASMILIEQSTAEVSDQIVQSVSIPVIGCCAGPACHGHVIVLHDLLGLTQWQPSFAQPITEGGTWLADKAAQWVKLVGSGDYLHDDHPYKMNAPSDKI